MPTVIIGGGIIGLAIAYYLSESLHRSKDWSDDSLHIIDSSPELFESASGYAGGFVARDWFNPHVESLGALSFRLHRELAEKYGGARKWGYAGSHVYSLGMDEDGVDATGKKAKSGGDWILEGTSRANEVRTNSEADADGPGVKRGDVVNADGSPAVFTPQKGGSLETIAGPEECAQVEPRELCQFLLDECKKRGVQVHLATRADRYLTDTNDINRPAGLKVVSTLTKEESFIQCDNVVIAAGAWTPRVADRLFPTKIQIPIEPLAGHSVVVKSPRYKAPFLDPYKRNIGGGSDNWLCYSIYAGPTRHWNFATEAYARLARDGDTEIWLGGVNDSKLPLPELATDVKGLRDPKSAAIVRKTIVQLTGLSKEGDELHHDDLETVREALCFRPVSRSGNPIIAKLEPDNLALLGADFWIASGHGPWGISLSLGTGLVMSELIQGKQPSADISHLGHN